MEKIVGKSKACKHNLMERKVFKMKGSLYVNLPQAFCRRHNVQAGDKMAVAVGEILKVMPMEKGE